MAFEAKTGEVRLIQKRDFLIRVIIYTGIK
jgi:hypothetical protein